jgi:hypothetical protein
MTTIHLGGQAVTIDLNRLTPTARALAQAIADHPSRAAVDIWVEADRPIRDTLPDWAHWYTETEAARPERRPWRGWSTVPLGGGDPHQRLEAEAEKIPPGWHVLGASPKRPLVGAGPQRELTMRQVLELLRQRGRPITAATWRSYVARGQAPPPARHVERTPLWSVDDIDRWLPAAGHNA